MSDVKHQRYAEPPDEPDNLDDFDDFEQFNEIAGLPVRNAPPKDEEPDSLDDIAALNELSDFDIPYYANPVEEQDDKYDDANSYYTDDVDADDFDDDEDDDEDELPEEEITGYRPGQLYEMYGMDDFDDMDEIPDESDIDAYDDWYEDFQEAVQQLDRDALFSSLSQLLHESKNTFAVNRKLMKKTIDVSWVEAIENGLVHVDNFLRNPRRTIEDVEEIVPIALSKKITVESIKHLAQHTDLIQSYDKKTGKITPSKILNVHKEESLMTYENKFVNTLIDRLYLFIHIRYEKLAKVAKDEQVYTLGYNTDINDGAGGKFKVEVKLETISSLDTKNEHGYTVWQRVEKLKKIIEGYKGSEFCTKLGNAYIRPPVMRTNAIMKNVDLKACLTLWQYIEGYDNAGYEITVEDNIVRPEQEYIEDFYRVVLMNLILFRSSMEGQDKAGKLRAQKKNKHRTIKPKFIRHFENVLSDDYSVSTTGAAGYIDTDGEQKIVTKLPRDADTAKIYNQISQIEQNYQTELEKIRKEKETEAELAEKRRAEKERIDNLRREELERQEREREEEQRRLEEMLALKKAEQEEADRERERQEQERLRLLEEKQKQEEEERIRREEEERIAEEQRKIEEERQRLEDEKMLVRSELGEAEGMDAEHLPELPDETEIEITEEELEQAKASLEELETTEFEDPREVAVRTKLEQQKREKERAERERAERLKAEREYFQNKPFYEIHKEYSKNPFYAIPRFIRWLLVVLFHLIPEDTDNPDWKRMLAELKQKQKILDDEKAEKEKMEVYYRKYAQTFKYRFRRSIEDYKFRKKREKERKGTPRPAYVPPNRTHEEELRIQKQMKRLYREYHVSLFEKIRRAWDEFRRNQRNNP